MNADDIAHSERLVADMDELCGVKELSDYLRVHELPQEPTVNQILRMAGYRV